MNLSSLWRRAVAALFAGALLVSLTSYVESRRAAPLIGLAQAVYASPDLSGPPVVVRKATGIGISEIRTDPALPQRQMSVRWDGFWFVPRGGAIRLSVMADDEVRVWLDDELVADRHVTDGYRTHVDPVVVEPGVHGLRVEYVQYGGGMAVDVLWAPLGLDFSPLAAERLFVERPDDTGIMVAARVRTLRVVERIAWTVVAFLVLLGALVGATRLVKAAWHSGWRRRSWEGVTAFGRDRRVQRVAVGAAGLGAVYWAFVHRLAALNPLTLWADDIWVAALASRPSLLEALQTPAPVPPGFLLLQWMARHLATEPGLALQVLPLTYAFVGAVALAVIASWLTGSRALGLVALTLAVLDPFMAQVSVFSKQYTLDALVSSLLLAVAVRACAARPVPLRTAAAAGTVAALFSFPSAFVSVALVHVLGWRALAQASNWPERRRAFASVALFDAVMAAIYWLVLQPRRSSTMTSSWTVGFLPTDDVDAGLAFVASRGPSVVTQALPDALAFLAPFCAIGLLWLVVRRQWRVVGLVLVVTYGGLLVASALGLYPIGRGYHGRVVLFSNPLVVLLMVSGIAAVTSRLPGRVLVRSVVALAALAFLARHPAVVSYFDHNHSAFVRALVTRQQPADAVIVNDRASYLVGVYAGWPSSIVPSRRPEQFYLRFERPLTLTLPPRAERGEGLDELERLLREERPGRVLLLSTRRETDVVEEAITRAGYRLTEARSSTTATVLAIYERGGGGDVSTATTPLPAGREVPSGRPIEAVRRDRRDTTTRSPG